ncbi:MAG: monooxygenase [Burkholderiales bacterium]|nr:monooxygenase [Burkholderiales bacterium]
MTHKLLQIDFAFDGPWGGELAAALGGLAQDIAAEKGLAWKLWTENPAERRAGGIYLFDDDDARARYLEKHTARLAAFGVREIVARAFDVNAPLSALTRAPL